MELKDYLAIASPIFSGIALSISAFTAYWNLLRGARYVSPPVRWVALGRMPGSGLLIMNLHITIANVGNRTGVIDCFSLELYNTTTKKGELFYALQEGNFVRGDFSGFTWEIPSPVTLKAGEGTVRYLIFYPHTLDYMYDKGIYHIVLYAHLGLNKRIKLYQQEVDIQSIVEPTPLPNQLPYIHSHHLVPTSRFVISNYGIDPPNHPTLIHLPDQN